MCYRVKAEPDWGIDKDIIFGAFFEQGQLTKLEFFKEEDVTKEADYLMAATPQVWKKILRKERKFVTDFMLGKIKLEHGSKVGTRNRRMATHFFENTHGISGLFKNSCQFSEKNLIGRSFQAITDVIGTCQGVIERNSTTGLAGVSVDGW